MKSNEDAEWVGLDRMVACQKEQLEKFRAWAANGDWDAFHNNHYDWWAFPINRASGYGYAYTVFDAEIEALTATPQYTDRLKELATLQMLAFGWLLEEAASVPNRSESQGFHGDTRVARLEKCGLSLTLFGLCDEFRSVQRFAHVLLDKGVRMDWDGRNYARWWRTAAC